MADFNGHFGSSQPSVGRYFARLQGGRIIFPTEFAKETI